MERFQQAANINNKGLVRKNYSTDAGKGGFAYLKYRVMRPLLKLYTRQLNRKYEFAPWTSPASVKIFDRLLTRKMIGLEYGSGRSTVFFARRLKQLVSVEHHRGWYEKISGFLQEKGTDNVEYILREPQDRVEETFDFFERYNLDSGDMRVKSRYRDYFSEVNRFPDEHFDFVLIDGRARVECLLNSIPKVKKGGFLVLDNSERTRYSVVFDVLKEWKRVETTNGLTNTTFWFRE